MAPAGAAGRRRRPPRRSDRHAAGLLEWRVLVVSLTLFLYSFGYGGITSFAALYADANGVDAEGHLPDGAGRS